MRVVAIVFPRRFHDPIALERLSFVFLTPSADAVRGRELPMVTLATDRRKEWRFVLELYRHREGETGERIAVAKVQCDFDSLIEAARFARVERTAALDFELGAEAAVIAPVWHEELGEPYVEAVRAEVSLPTGEAAEAIAPTAFFRQHAEAAAGKVIEEGLLQDHESFRYLVTAYPQAPQYAPQTDRFRIEPVGQPLHLGSRPIESLRSRARVSGEIDDGPFPVFVPEFLLDEIRERMASAGAVETGGILLGHIHRDPDAHTVFLEVTAQIPARHTQQELTSLTFTPETWSDVDAAVALRDQAELRLGWWHSHPAKEWCRNCPEENRRVCKRSGEFFSSDDIALHRTIFPRAYSIGLVVSDSFAHGLTFPMFGWKNGLIQTRGFYVVD